MNQIKIVLESRLEKERASMNQYSKEVREFVEQHGELPCDYVNHRRDMEFFHRGRVNLLIELIKELEL